MDSGRSGTSRSGVAELAWVTAPMATSVAWLWIWSPIRAVPAPKSRFAWTSEIREKPSCNMT